MAGTACTMGELVREILSDSAGLVRRKGLGVHVLGNLHEELPLDKDDVFTLLSRLFLEAATTAPCHTMVTITSEIDADAWHCSVEHKGHESLPRDDRCTLAVQALQGSLERIDNPRSPGTTTLLTVPVA